jgi:hypothetical protein
MAFLRFILSSAFYIFLEKSNAGFKPALDWN